MALDRHPVSASDELEPLRGDIAVRVAQAMLDAVFPGKLCEITEGHGLTLVVLPSEDWAGVVRDGLRLTSRYGQPPTRIRDGQLSSKAGTDDWAFVEVTGRVGCSAQTRIGVALSLGIPVVAVAAADDRKRLPLGMEGAADRVLVLGPPDWAVVHRAAVACYGVGPVPSPTEECDPSLLEALTPSVMTMCHRQGQGADEFCARLVQALETVSKPQQAIESGPRGLARVPGLSAEVCEWVQALLRDLADYRAGRIGWADVDRGAVISGPPGCGKSTLAHALAEEAGVPLISSSYAAWQSHGHQGEMLKAMRRSFGEARGAAPCILFLDELDSFPDRRRVSGDNGGYMMQVVNALLAELDGAVSREGVVVVGACNNASLLDPALTRPGRLERVLVLGRPNASGIEAALRVHLAGELRDEPLADIATLAHGMTGAEAEAVVRTAKRSARVLGRPMMRGDLLVAVAAARGIDLLPARVVHAS